MVIKKKNVAARGGASRDDRGQRIGDRKKRKAEKGLKINCMEYVKIVDEDASGWSKKISGLVLQQKIVMLQGKLLPEEETRVIENSMMLIGNIKGFQGIEIAAISGDGDNRGLFEKVRHNIAKILVGERDAITIIGPATVVKEITRNPRKIELMLQRR